MHWSNNDALADSESGEADTGRGLGGRPLRPNRTQQWLAPTYCSATH